MMFKTLLFVLVFFICDQTWSQSFHSFTKLSGPEKWWVVTHIFVAKKTYRLSQSVLHVCDSLKQKNVFTGNGNGDQLDAFRHTYWMALLCQYIKPKKVLKLGIAHEKGNYIAFKKGKLEEGEQPDSMSCVMDLINNKKGIESGLSVKNKTSVLNREELIKKMIEQVKQGQAFILLKDQNNHFLTCNHEIILSHLYKGKWSIPKCLVKSNVLE